MVSYKNFLAKFSFKPEYAFRVGVERECFLRQVGSGVIQDSSAAVHALMEQGAFAKYFSPELSACQYECKTDPLAVDDLGAQLSLLEAVLQQQLAEIGLYGDFTEVAEETMPLTVYPNPRYIKIVDTLPIEVLSAACRVAGTHVHVGMPDLATAIMIYNRIRDRVDQLRKLGDHSSGERLRLYEVMAPQIDPPFVERERGLYKLALEQGFAQNPRDWWSEMRITIYGTIEFRAFGSTSSVPEIEKWARFCRQLCLDAHRAISRELNSGWCWGV
jgi:hypothetical protein